MKETDILLSQGHLRGYDVETKEGYTGIVQKSQRLMLKISVDFKTLDALICTKTIFEKSGPDSKSDKPLYTYV